MAIKANEQLVSVISNRLLDYSMGFQNIIAETAEVLSMLKNIVGNCCDINKIVANSTKIEAQAREFSYANGLLYLDSSISYLDQFGSEEFCRQITITADYLKPPLINLLLTKCKKSTLQIMLESNNLSQIPSEMIKTVEVLQTKVFITNHNEGTFTSYKNLSNGSIMSEKYEQDNAYIPLIPNQLEKLNLDLIYNNGFSTFFSDNLKKAIFNCGLNDLDNEFTKNQMESVIDILANKFEDAFDLHDKSFAESRLQKK